MFALYKFFSATMGEYYNAYTFVNVDRRKWKISKKKITKRIKQIWNVPEEGEKQNHTKKLSTIFHSLNGNVRETTINKNKIEYPNTSKNQW